MICNYALQIIQETWVIVETYNHGESAKIDRLSYKRLYSDTNIRIVIEFYHSDIPMFCNRNSRFKIQIFIFIPYPKYGIINTL